MHLLVPLIITAIFILKYLLSVVLQRWLRWTWNIKILREDGIENCPKSIDIIKRTNPILSKK